MGANVRGGPPDELDDAVAEEAAPLIREETLRAGERLSAEDRAHVAAQEARAHRIVQCAGALVASGRKPRLSARIIAIGESMAEASRSGAYAAASGGGVEAMAAAGREMANGIEALAAILKQAGISVD